MKSLQKHLRHLIRRQRRHLPLKGKALKIRDISTTNAQTAFFPYGESKKRTRYGFYDSSDNASKSKRTPKRKPWIKFSWSVCSKSSQKQSLHFSTISALSPGSNFSIFHNIALTVLSISFPWHFLSLCFRSDEHCCTTDLTIAFSYSSPFHTQIYVINDIITYIYIYFQHICLYVCDNLYNAQKGEQSLMYFYQHLRDLREDADASQYEIAKVLGISQQHYYMYESGKRELPMHHFITLAKYYNVSLDYLAGLIHSPRKLQ